MRLVVSTPTGSTRARSAALELFGQRLPSPLIVAPTGFNGLAYGQGDLALARGAAALGLPVPTKPAHSQKIAKFVPAIVTAQQEAQKEDFMRTYGPMLAKKDQDA